MTEITQPTDWVNSIVCNVRETPDGKKKARLCLDPKALNKQIRREHHYSHSIDEILPHLQGNFFSLVVGTKWGTGTADSITRPGCYALSIRPTGGRVSNAYPLA